MEVILLTRCSGFFGFSSDLPDSSSKNWDEDSPQIECNKLDELNDETFGTGAQQGDWEPTHKQVAFHPIIPTFKF